MKSIAYIKLDKINIGDREDISTTCLILYVFNSKSGDGAAAKLSGVDFFETDTFWSFMSTEFRETFIVFKLIEETKSGQRFLGFFTLPCCWFVPNKVTHERFPMTDTNGKYVNIDITLYIELLMNSDISRHVPFTSEKADYLLVIPNWECSFYYNENDDMGDDDPTEEDIEYY